MSCCVGFAQTKQRIESVVEAFYPDDYKIFAISREALADITYKIRLGVVVKPDVDKNTSMFEELKKLESNTGNCIKVVSSNINFKDEKLVDLFLLDIEVEVS
jgi:hypothetical protein